MAKKEFKPAQYKKLSDDQKAILDKTNDQWESHPFVKNYHGRWEEYIAWFEGDQYKIYNELSENLEDLKPMIERETKNVYNRIMPLIRQMWGELRYPHEFYVIPNTTEGEDIRAAYVASQLIEFTNEQRKFNKKVNFSKLWALITGVCFWKEWWNKNLLATTVGNGKKTTEVKGDVDYDYVCPFNCRPDPTSLNREDWKWFIEGKKVLKSAIEEEFELEPGTLPKRVSQQATWDSHIFERKSIGIHSYEAPKEDYVIRKEHWLTPYGDYPKGRFLVMVDDWLLYDDVNPAPRGQIPYFTIPGIIPLLGEQAFDSAVRIAQHPQRQLNRYASMIDEHIKNWKIKGMIPWGSMRPGDQESFERAGVDYVTFNSRFGQPYYQSPPPLPDTIVSWLTFMEREVETETSVREVSYARLPKYSSRASGVLFEGLKGQDEAVLYPAVEEIDSSLQDATSFRLELIQQHYDEKRLVKTVGRKRLHTIGFFEGAELRDNRDVRVVPGVDIMTSRKKKEDIVMALVEKGFITEPRKAFEVLGIKTVEEFMEDEFIDERQADRQLQIMKDSDTYIAPEEHDNHEIMYETFNNARKAEDFESLPKKIQENIKRRIDEEAEFIAPEETPAAAETPAAPGEEVPPAVPGVVPGVPAAGVPAVGAPGAVGAPAIPAAPTGASPNPPVTPEEILMILMQQGGI